jgi:hypothetical protein
LRLNAAAFGTQMAAAGTPMRTLQELMGHADIKTTERYADFLADTKDAQWVRINGSITPQRSSLTIGLAMCDLPLLEIAH